MKWYLISEGTLGEISARIDSCNCGHHDPQCLMTEFSLEEILVDEDA